DSSAIRKLDCAAGGNLLIKSAVVIQQFGELLAALHLSSGWRGGIAERVQAADGDDTHERHAQTGREELEAEQKRAVLAYTKGLLAEEDLDEIIQPIRTELQSLPMPQLRDTQMRIAAAITAGERLAEVAGQWNEAGAEERRDMIWS